MRIKFAYKFHGTLTKVAHSNFVLILYLNWDSGSGWNLLWATLIFCNSICYSLAQHRFGQKPWLHTPTPALPPIPLSLPLTKLSLPHISFQYIITSVYFRCDSMGFCAQFGSYTLLDLNTNKILDMQPVSVSVYI